MATFQINDDEWCALSGLPLLAREVYFVLRRHMDFSTGITGLKRKVSLKAITEELYVEPHQGMKEQQLSEQQIRRALDWLEKRGLIKRDKSFNKSNRQSVFKLILATRDYSVKNKADSNPTKQADSNPTKAEESNSSGSNGFDDGKADNAENAKADMPPISDIKTTNTTSPYEKFLMTLEWVPDPKILRTLKLNAGIPNVVIPVDVIQEFRAFWRGRAELEKSEYDWIRILVNQVKKNYVKEKGNANRTAEYSGGSRKSNESLVERTRRELDEWVAE